MKQTDLVWKPKQHLSTLCSPTVRVLKALSKRSNLSTSETLEKLLWSHTVFRQIAEGLRLDEPKRTSVGRPRNEE